MTRTIILMAMLFLAVQAADNAVAAPKVATGLRPQTPSLEADAVTIPRMLSYQGRLTDTMGIPVVDTTYSVEFRLYTVPTGGAPFWSETQSVRTSGGLFSVLLGSVTPIDTMPAVGAAHLGMAVAGGAELAPRLRIASTAYSYLSERAADADQLQGKDTIELDGRYVNEGQGNSVTSAMMVNGTIAAADFGQMGASSGQVMKWTGSAWQPRNDSVGSGGSGDNAWTRVGSDSVLYTIHQLGIARGGAGNALHGESTHTHVNLGVACTTGKSGQDYPYCTVGGGYNNNATGWLATVGGGYNNDATGDAATVGGGRTNGTDATCATVGGGYTNEATGAYATIGGGAGNTAETNYATVGGGYNNTATGSYATVGGGDDNGATGDYATVGGGAGNAAETTYATVGGGQGNSVSGHHATISGGQGNIASNFWATVGGGYSNTASGSGATVGGGAENNASGTAATVAGGFADSVMGAYGGVLSGYGNVAGDVAADSGTVVAGGRFNRVTTKYGAVGGGEYGSVEGSWGGVLSGRGNRAGNSAADTAAVVAGGWQNRVDGPYSFNGGGRENHVYGGYSVIGGGQDNATMGGWAAVAGGYSNSTEASYTSIGGGRDNYAGELYATIAGGNDNSAGGEHASVGGGRYCRAVANFAVVAGGDSNVSHYMAAVGGGSRNHAQGYWSAVAGGHADTALAHYGGALAGYHNLGGDASADTGALVAGGVNNRALAKHTAIGGGQNNTAVAAGASIGGGSGNYASSNYTTIAGGLDNHASGWYSAIPGGNADTCAGHYAMVMGSKVRATSSADFTFAYGEDFTTSTARAVVFHHSGAATKLGVGVQNPTHNIDVQGGAYCNGTDWVNGSSRDLKKNSRELTPDQMHALLSQLEGVQVVQYQYKADASGEEHIGIAVENAPELLATPERDGINTADAIGFLLAVAKAQQAEIEQLKAELQRR